MTPVRTNLAGIIARPGVLGVALAGTLIGLLAPALPGCVMIHPAGGASGGSSALAPAHNDGHDGARETESIWPARWGTPGSPRGVVVGSVFGPAQLRTAHLGRFHRLRLRDVEYAQAETLQKAVGEDAGFRFEAEGPGAFLFVDPSDPDAKPREPTASDPFETVVFVTGTLLDREDNEDRVALERTWLSFYDASPPPPVSSSAPNAAPKGTILLIPGMFGTPEPVVESMVRYWRSSGYAVVRMLSHPSRFTERLSVKVRSAEVEQLGERLAKIYDERTAECAYAADAGLSAFFERRPAMADRPVVLVGMSGGAIVLSSVAAYAPDRYAAAVFIAGGSDFLTISATSNYADWIDAVELDWAPDDDETTGTPDPDVLAALSNAYLASSRLDAAHTAPMLRGPRLVLQATGDKAVPVPTGNALWEQLGKPERWTYPVGHELIFMTLPTQAERITRWIDAAVTPEPRPEPAPEPAAP